ncbi:MAG: phosphotransferase, partial [Myxococcales bacterium]|nr:phosphotransferase [Myxococcales bacterium]
MPTLDHAALTWVATTCGAHSATAGERIQSLWSGYGEIRRVRLHGAAATVGSAVDTVVVKWVRPPAGAAHPRGWGSDRSHQRKLRSYAVEHRFYEYFAAQTHAACRVPACLGVAERDHGQAFILEDLDAAGFARRFEDRPRQLAAAVAWLAHFHATFLGTAPTGLWPEGAYWHLATRPDELAATSDPRLKHAAAALDARLTGARFRTLIHGDAKVDNFCFTADHRAAAVDFQYVGGGCGVKDLAYLLGSALTEPELLAQADGLVDAYFAELRPALPAAIDADALEA